MAFVVIIMLPKNIVNWKLYHHEKTNKLLINITEEIKEKHEDQQPMLQTRKGDGRSRNIDFISKEKPTLVIFTTFKAFSPHHTMAHKLVTLNWASFGGVIKPVLFANLTDLHNHQVSADSFLISNAIKHGWDVLPLTSTNEYGTPHLKPMYEEIFKRYNATFYGYANGDLLFNEDMVESLLFLKTISKSQLSDNALLVGKRTDILLSLNDNSRLSLNENSSSANYFIKDIKDFEVYFSKSNLPKLTKTGVLRGVFVIDYFFFTRDNSTFNWSAIANVVIGRRAYDQYLIAMANRFDVNTVDLSRVVVTAHLSKPGVPDTSSFSKDNLYNIEMIGQNFPYNDGLTSTAFFYLIKNDRDNSLYLVERPHNRPKRLYINVTIT